MRRSAIFASSSAIFARMRSSDVSMAALLILNMTTCYFGILARCHSRGMRSIVSTRLSIRLTTSRRLKLSSIGLHIRSQHGYTTLSSSRRTAWRTNFTLRHSPLPPVYSLLTSQPHRFAVEGASAGCYQNYICETGWMKPVAFHISTLDVVTHALKSSGHKCRSRAVVVKSNKPSASSLERLPTCGRPGADRLCGLGRWGDAGTSLVHGGAHLPLKTAA
jgi:hypothetical protein